MYLVMILQQLCIANVDRPISEGSVCSLDTFPLFKHSWELLDFIPGARVLEAKRPLWQEAAGRQEKEEVPVVLFLLPL